MKIRGSVVGLSFIFPHPPEDENKNKKKVPLYRSVCICYFYYYYYYCDYYCCCYYYYYCCYFHPSTGGPVSTTSSQCPRPQPPPPRRETKLRGHTTGQRIQTHKQAPMNTKTEHKEKSQQAHQTTCMFRRLPLHCESLVDRVRWG